MMIDRRFFITGTGASLLMPSNVAFGLPSDKRESNAMFVASRKNADGTFSAAIFSPEAGDIVSVPLPARGHDAVVRPGTNSCVIFARRPGNFAVVLSADGRKKPFWFTTKENRHFYGHGVFSPDGKLLYSTENDFENDQGVIGIRDATSDFRQIGEFTTEGIGPHDIALLSDGRTLVVANGGILTHPDTGRMTLNLADMEPSLTYLDLRTGDVLEQVILPREIHKLSIRHLAVAKNDVVAFGCQYQGPKVDQPPLMGFHRRGKEPKLVTAPTSVHRIMKNYVGSVAADSSGELIAASCPRGNIVTYWDAMNFSYIGERAMRDVCGLARTSSGGEFLHTTGEGVVSVGTPVNSSQKLPSKFNAKVAWDNHAVMVPET